MAETPNGNLAQFVGCKQGLSWV